MGSCDAAVCCDSQSDSICASSSTNPRLSNCFTVSFIPGVAVLFPTIHRTLLFDPKISNFDLSVPSTLFHCPIVNTLCALAYWSLLTLFCFLNSDFLTAILAYKPTSPCLLPTVDVFPTLVQLYYDIWIGQPSVTQSIDSDEIVLCSCCFWSTSLSSFLMSPDSIIHCSSGNFYF